MSKSRDLGEFPAAALDIDASGNVNLTGDVSLADNDKLILGDGSDLEIFHDGANSYISDNGTGNLYVRASDNMFFQSSDNVHRYAEFINGGAVKLRFDNSHKMQTTATGINVTGTVTADGLTVDGAATVSGNVGIGNSDPAVPLDVRKAGGGNFIANFQNTTAGTPYGVSIKDAVSGASGYPLLQVTNSAGSAAYFKVNSGNGGVNVGGNINLSANDTYVGFPSNGIYYNNSADHVSVKTGAVERVRIDSAGNVGIGTTNPNSLGSNITTLNIKGGVNDRTGGLRLTSLDNSVDGYMYGAASLMTFGTQTATPVRFLTSGSERMRIDAAGHLLVGITSSLGQTCTVRGDTNTTTEGTIYLANNGGAAAYASFGDSAGTITGYIQKSGSGVNYASISDKRLKENITDSNDAGSKIDAIQVRQYDWKADGSHQDYGMIAQELISVAPDAVSGSENTDDMMGVDFSKLVPMLIKEVQSLRARVAALESI